MSYLLFDVFLILQQPPKRSNCFKQLLRNYFVRILTCMFPETRSLSIRISQNGNSKAHLSPPFNNITNFVKEYKRFKKEVRLRDWKRTSLLFVFRLCYFKDISVAHSAVPVFRFPASAFLTAPLPSHWSPACNP